MDGMDGQGHGWREIFAFKKAVDMDNYVGYDSYKNRER